MTKPNPTFLVCERPDCGVTFRRVTNQRFCSYACRVAARVCARCKQPSDGLSYCPPCGAEQAREYRSAPEIRAASVQAFRLKVYGLTVEQYNAMAEAQGWVCAICHRPEMSTRRGVKRTLCVDHCHETGRIRGLLCSQCNTAIGLMADAPDRLRAAADYLAR